jgi:hypothetical protein
VQVREYGGERRTPSWVPAALVAGGLAVICVSLGFIPVDPGAFRAPHWVIGCIGACIFIAGLLVASRANPSAVPARFLVALLFSLFAAVLDWVGFGPGPRAFSSAASVFGVTVASSSSESPGSILFAAMGVVATLIALAAWWSFARALLRERGAGTAGG